jgi:hypothetical protein
MERWESEVRKIEEVTREGLKRVVANKSFAASRRNFLNHRGVIIAGDEFARNEGHDLRRRALTAFTSWRGQVMVALSEVRASPERDFSFHCRQARYGGDLVPTVEWLSQVGPSQEREEFWARVLNTALRLDIFDNEQVRRDPPLVQRLERRKVDRQSVSLLLQWRVNGEQTDVVLSEHEKGFSARLGQFPDEGMFHIYPPNGSSFVLDDWPKTWQVDYSAY